MTFEERYSEAPDFWNCLHDMANISEAIGDESIRDHMRHAIWAIGWIANVDGHRSTSALRKLWEQTAERAPRLPKRIEIPSA